MKGRKEARRSRKSESQEGLKNQSVEMLNVEEPHKEEYGVKQWKRVGRHEEEARLRYLFCAD